MKKVSEVYKSLFHYTGWNGLLGIIESQTIWATHCRFSNDFSEVRIFRDKLVEFLKPHVIEVYENAIEKAPGGEEFLAAQGGLSAVIEHDAIRLVESLYEVTGDEIYIASFCGEHADPFLNKNGLLSQWRGYGIGGGFAIEFDAAELEKIIEIEAKSFGYGLVHFSDVIYSDDEAKFKDELSDQLNHLAEYTKQMFLSILKEKDETVSANKSFPAFINCISRYKHHGFKEENEVRLVAMPINYNKKYLELAKKKDVTLLPEKDRKFRLRRDERIPYIEFFSSSDIVLPVKRIIVGPHREKDARALALKTMLRNSDIAVEVSEIPYIGT